MTRRPSYLVASLLAILGFAFVFAASPAAAVTEKVIYTFQGGRDGGQPWATMLLDDRTGTLYGTTEVGGNRGCSNYFQHGCGVVFSLTPSPSGWTEAVLYRFQGGVDGGHPRSPLFWRPDGFFYGTTSAGGGFGSQGGVGTAYRIKVGTWKENVLFGFSLNSNGWYPQGSIGFDSKGDLYGQTTNGGAGDAGAVFELVPSSSGPWSERLLTSMTGTPVGGAVIDSQGNVYGTSTSGGIYNEGDVFELSPSPSGWKFTELYSFQVACGMFCGGAQPGSLTITKDGRLFGFAGDAGFPGCNGFGCGTVFELVNSNGTWQEKTLYSFHNLADGWGPGWGAPAFDRYGNLFGTTGGGGTYGAGTVFELSRTNAGWQKTTLYAFPGGAGGSDPLASGLVLDRNGNIFGSTYDGGLIGGKTCKNTGCGVVFEVSP